MEYVLEEIRKAYLNHLLVNIYLVSGDIFYTGYIDRYNEHEVLVKTYESTAMADGFVAIKLFSIESIEHKSEDLDRIEEKMVVVENDNLLQFSPKPVNFASKINLFQQILIQSYLDKQMMLIQENDSEKFYTGIIKKINNDSIEFLVINKFKLSENYLKNFAFSNIRLIEFQGRELETMSKVIDKVSPSDSIAHTVKSINHIIEMLTHSFDQQSFIEVNARYNHNYFYVGKVIMINEDSIILKVVDMAGQFGGYVLMRMLAIDSVTINTDYLKIMQLMVQNNIKQKIERQPVLNADRQFDITENNLLLLLNQSLRMKHLIRLQLKNGNVFLGYPSLITNEYIKFNLLDETRTFFINDKEIPVNDIAEIGFDYIQAYLDERRLKLNGDL
ncbi:hypothetical protein DY138_03935 [Apilactobacillus timberlakei]|uniref:hypothetical protein n=1 Tax=Apilactobacillus timberlakei TaxID=2008380 RepID=UPI00112D7169|nr:hypothetical protein [Apilactobacillus timberlakei]TPR18774.1 hypothetical protein DY138_03935 [Apilactobacillus timberlakei]TPR21061.1 hypothetical protein DY061_03200 [Apilactobacillus timberlakei]TPR23712.1 hypothetical protein DY083_01070 [Apilactobacillus timberlakei]